MEKEFNGFDFSAMDEESGEMPDNQSDVVEEEEVEEEVESEESDEDFSEEDAQEDEENSEEAEEEIEPEQPKQQQRKPYTPEEVKELLKEGEFDAIDTSRLSEEGQLVMRAMQSGLTPKLQEAAEIRKELEKLQEQFEETKPKPQPKDIYEAFDQDPQGVSQYITDQIASMVSEDPMKHAADIERLRDLKDELRERKLQRVESRTKEQEQVAKVFQSIKQEVPDIESKDKALAEFALKEMGYTPEELQRETSPKIAGMNAVKTIARINRLYERFQAANTVKKKSVKRRPTKVEKAGRGFEKAEPSRKELIEKAKQTGNWRDLLYDLPE